MKTGRILARILAAATLAATAQIAMAIELGLEGTASNLQLPWAPLTPITDAAFPATNYFWGSEAWMTAPLGEDASIRLSYEHDQLTRNSLIGAVQFERGIARISVGPRIGFLNSASVPISAGLSASVRLQWPGVAYVSLRSDGGMAISVLQADSDPQAFTELAAGVYVPHAIVSGIVSAKRFSELDASKGLVTDSLTHYGMTIDIFKKNVPYTALLSMGYELRSKHYATGNVTDSLGAVILGLDSGIQLSNAIKLLGGISTGAYVFGLDALKGRGPEVSAFLFTASLGLAVETSALDFTKRPKAPAAEPAVAAAVAPEPEEQDAATAPPAPQEVAAETPKPAFSRLAIDAGTGLYYNDRIALAGDFAILGAIFNARGGVWGSIGYRITPQIIVGGEIGLDYITMTSGDVKLSLFDLPIRASARYMLGKIGLEAFGGAFINGIATNAGSVVPYVDLDVGGRIRLGGLYAEASYVIGVGSTTVDLAGLGSIRASYPRFGLGFSIPIIK